MTGQIDPPTADFQGWMAEFHPSMTENQWFTTEFQSRADDFQS
jgi:hypothetical protein